LHIDPAAEALRTLCWEALRDQKPPPRRLATQHGTPLSRFVDGGDLEPVRGARLKLLVVVSNPGGLGPPEWPGLEDYDAGAELAMVEDTLRRLDDRIDYDVHRDGASPQRVRDRLLVEHVDVLHLVAPGVGGNGSPSRLLLEQDAGAGPDAVMGDVVGPMVDGLASLRLVVLSTGYTSAGSAADAHLDIAAQLLDFGVPAVLAMQGKAKETAEVFTKAFYDTLLHSSSSYGLVDVAANHAREAVWFRRRDAWDWAAPVVFLGGEGHIYEADPAEVADVALPGVQPGVGVGVPAVLPERQLPVAPAGSPAQRRLEAFHLLTAKHRFTSMEVADLAWSLNIELGDGEEDLGRQVRDLITASERAGKLEELIQQIVLIVAQRQQRRDDDPALRALGSLTA
ncbi:MAG: CHAT domain-containing protein, partial [Solirubrobacteraceae bacterium]